MFVQTLREFSINVSGIKVHLIGELNLVLENYLENFFIYCTDRTTGKQE